MRIGIDARALADPLTGIGRFTFNVVNEFYRHPGGHDFFLYSYKPFSCFFQRGHWSTRFGKTIARINGTGHLLTEAAVAIKNDRLDVFWTPFPILPGIPGVRKVLTVHDIAWLVTPKTFPADLCWFHRIMVPFSLRRAQKVFSVSEATRQNLKKYYPWFKGDVILTPNAVSTDFFHSDQIHPRSELDRLIGTAGPYLFTVLRLEKRKNVIRLLQAFRLLKQQQKFPHKLVIAGDKGPEAKRIRKFCKENKLQDDVVFLGYITETQLISLYHYAAAFVFPSLYEGFGIPPLEAMACGCPVVASNISSMPEVIGDAGLYFDPYDVKDVADKIAMIISDDNLRRDLVCKGHQRKNYFSWKKTAGTILDELIKIGKG